MKIELSRAELIDLNAAIYICLKPEEQGGCWKSSLLRRSLPPIKDRIMDLLVSTEGASE